MVASPTYAIRRRSSYGPTFGGGHDIHIANNANSNTNSYTNFGYYNYYSLPSGVQDRKTILAGTYKFTPDEVEVFYLGWIRSLSNSVKHTQHLCAAYWNRSVGHDKHVLHNFYHSTAWKTKKKKNWNILELDAWPCKRKKHFVCNDAATLCFRLHYSVCLGYTWRLFWCRLTRPFCQYLGHVSKHTKSLHSFH